MKASTRKWWKRIGIAVLVLIAIGILVALPTILSGYTMYKDAIEHKPLETAIAAVQSRSDFLSVDDIPKPFIDKLLYSEDQRFYYHVGVDLISIGRAILINLQERSFAQGGSTLTQQVAKNLYFTFEKRIDRKVAEVFMAFRLEHLLTKDEILEIYCNIAYFGENCYGLRAASKHYYDVEPLALTEAQMDALVYTIKSPNNFNPNVIKTQGIYAPDTPARGLRPSTRGLGSFIYIRITNSTPSGWLHARYSPPCNRTISFTMARPRPDPFCLPCCL